MMDEMMNWNVTDWAAEMSGFNSSDWMMSNMSDWQMPMADWNESQWQHV